MKKSYVIMSFCLIMSVLQSCKEVEVIPEISSPADKAYINLQHSGITSNMIDVRFFDPINGFALSTDVLLKTINGGTNWTKITPIDTKVDTVPRFSKLCFPTENLGFLVGQKAKVSTNANGNLTYTPLSTVFLKTEDAGKTWTDINFFETITNIVSIEFYNQKIGLISTSGIDFTRIYKTTDAGETWTLVEDKIVNYGHDGSRNGSLGLYDLEFITASKVIGVGSAGTIYISLDGGSSWVKDENTPQNRGFKSVKFSDENNGYVVGGGESFPNEDKAFVYKIHLHDDGTTSYQNVTDRYHSVFWHSDLALLENGKAIWTCGHLGQVFASYDGGKNWSDELTKSPRQETLNALSFPNDQVGYFVGNGGVILKVDLSKE
jgi:photosystem II stability/assembly factor-like uncharacterized protein